MKSAPTFIAAMLALVFAAACETDDDPVAPPPVNVRPNAITDLAAEVSGDDVALLWTSPADGEAIALRADPVAVTAYDIRRSSSRITDETWTAAAVLESPVPRSPGLAETTMVRDLTPGMYFFAVRSMDGDSAWSALSNQASVTLHPPDQDAPLRITDLAVEIETATSVRLSWASPLDSTGVVAAYEGRSATAPITDVDWPTATPLPDPPDVREPGSTQTWIVPGLSTPAVYYFAVRSVDDSGNVSQTSNVVSITVLPDHTPPQAVGDLAAAEIGSETVTLLWTATGGDGRVGRAAAYYLRWSISEITPETWEEATEVPNALVPAMSGVGETYTLEGLPSDTVLFIALRVADDSGNISPLSNVVPVRTERETMAPGPITDLRAEDLTSGSVRLLWTAPGDDGESGQATRYDLRRASVPIDPARFETYALVPTPAPQIAGSSEFVVVENLVEEALYFALRAADEAGNLSPVSNVLRVDVPPAAVSMLVLPDGSGDYPTIQDALDAAPSGATIELEDGTFRGDGNWELVFPSVPVVLRSRSLDPERCTIDCEAGETLVRQAISGAQPLALGTLIDGITFRGGRSSDGVLHLKDSPGVSIRRCRLVDNRDGTEPYGRDSFDPAMHHAEIGPAGIRLTNSHVSFQDCLFQENIGNPVFVDASSHVTGSDCRFLANETNGTTGIHSDGGSVYLTDCEFEPGCAIINNDQYCGSSMVAVGGTAEIHDSMFRARPPGQQDPSRLRLESGAKVELFGTTVEGVSGNFGNAAISIEGGSRLSMERCRVTNLFGSNEIPYPAAFLCKASSLELRNCRIDAVRLRYVFFRAIVGDFENSDVLIENTISYGWEFSSKVLLYAVAGWYFDRNCRVTLRGSTFAQEEECLDCYPGTEVPTIYSEQSSLTVDRCILFGNDIGPAIEAADGTAAITCTDIYGNSRGSDSGPIPLNWPGWMQELLGIEGNLEADPLFCDPANLDYRLAPESPCAPFAGPGGKCDRIGALPVGCD